MNLQSSILRDGTKVHYLHTPTEVEAPRPSLLSALMQHMSQKFLPVRAGNFNKTNQPRPKLKSWAIRLLRS
jgi:hypothetical protein